MFVIRKERFGSLQSYTLLNSTTGEFVRIVPECGALVQEMTLRAGTKLRSVLMGVAASSLPINPSFRGSKLLPFPNRVAGGSYSFGGAKFQLDVNFPQEGNAIHGLLYTSNFSVFKRNVSKSGASLVLRFVYLGSEQGFPFHFRTTITYALTPRGFVCTTRVQNIGKTAMPLGDGWHPYFALLSPVDDLALQLPIVKRLAVRKMIPTGATISYDAYKNSRQIGGAVFDTGFVIQKKTGRAVTALIDLKDGTKCSLWQEVGREKYSYLQVYIPPDRKSIALEPMTCACNAFNNKMGLIVLQSGKAFSAKYGVALSSVSTKK